MKVSREKSCVCVLCAWYTATRLASRIKGRKAHLQKLIISFLSLSLPLLSRSHLHSFLKMCAITIFSLSLSLFIYKIKALHFLEYTFYCLYCILFLYSIFSFDEFSLGLQIIRTKVRGTADERRAHTEYKLWNANCEMDGSWKKTHANTAYI